MRLDGVNVPFLRMTNAYESLCTWKERTFHWSRINLLLRVLSHVDQRLVSPDDQPLVKETEDYGYEIGQELKKKKKNPTDGSNISGKNS